MAISVSHMQVESADGGPHRCLFSEYLISFMQLQSMYLTCTAGTLQHILDL